MMCCSSIRPDNVGSGGIWCRYIDEADLMRFMRDEEVLRALALFDGAMETGKITRRALKKWVVSYGRLFALHLSTEIAMTITEHNCESFIS